MLFTLQRYEFFSKSQRFLTECVKSNRCCLPYKGTNFSANHNISLCITYSLVMLFTLQRYEFFSKSQLILLNVILRGRCCLPYKGTNFSANHNLLTNMKIIYKMLFTLQRYEFFSKSQHLCNSNFNCA